MNLVPKQTTPLQNCSEWAHQVILMLVVLFGAVACGRSDGDSTASANLPPEPIVSAFEKSLRRVSPSERRAYFGDLHVHSSFSFDSYVEGNQLSDPGEAYRFALGESITLPGGRQYQLKRALDFTAVTDHAEGLADYSLCTAEDSRVYASDYCVRARNSDLSAFGDFVESLMERPVRRVAAMRDPKLDLDGASRAPWAMIRAAAEEFNAPGRFTTFIAYEYTGLLPGDGMLHRNVIFRGSDVPERALGAYELHTPEAFWSWLETACTDECEALAIPHNTNVSLGIAFRAMNTDGTPFNREILDRRARLEPLVEIHQHKGNSECALGLGNTDEECGFEQVQPVCAEGQTLHCIHPGSMVRNALKTGLEIAERFDINPFKYGIIASSDTHNSTSGAVDEDNFFGHDSYNDDTSVERISADPGTFFPKLLRNPGGLAGIWAEENTRESLFAGLARKEVFGTSGPRIRLRFFAGWGFPNEMLGSRDMISEAYRHGVAMGDDLPASLGDAPPQFLLWAVKDANDANLERIQIIKGWREGVETKERVYDVACGDGSKPDPVSHRCSLERSVVDLASCEVEGDRGAAELTTIWRDLDFNPRQGAFYYARVLQVPTCRWSTYDAQRLGVDPPSNVPATVRERGWSSPIWYSP